MQSLAQRAPPPMRLLLVDSYAIKLIEQEQVLAPRYRGWDMHSPAGKPERLHSCNYPATSKLKQCVFYACLVASLLLSSAVETMGQTGSDEVHIAVGPDRLVAADSQKRPLVEPHLAVRPGDANHMLAAAIAEHPNLDSPDCAAFASADGGKTWTRHDLGLKDCGDPWVVVLEDGTAILTVLGNKNQAATELLVYRSPDGGISWPDVPHSLGAGHDHETMVVDRRLPGQRNGSFYLTTVQEFKEPVTGLDFAAAFVTHSHDAGRTFSIPTRIFPSALGFNTHLPGVLSDGTLLVSFADYNRPSLDGQEWLKTERAWVIRSTDGGDHFSPPFLITESCGRSFSSMKVDFSTSGFRDRIYYLCHDYYFRNVFLHYSSDGGMTWSNPIQVNQSSGSSPLVRTPSMAVNTEGVLGVAWYDGRKDDRGFLGYLRCENVFFTASLDGGRTFLPEVMVSTEKSCPDSPENGMVGKRFPAGGDYQGMVALPDGSFHLLWSDSRSGVFELRTAIIKVNSLLNDRSSKK